MSLSKKVAILAVALFIVLFAALQWRLNANIKQLFAGLSPFAIITYSDAGIGLGGEVTIDDIVVTVHQPPLQFNVDRVSYSLGSLYDTVFAGRHAEAGQLPATIDMAVTGLRLPLADLVAAGGGQRPPLSSTDLLLSAACGDKRRIGAAETVAMGYPQLLVSARFALDASPDNETLQIRGAMDFDRIGKLRYEASTDYAVLHSARIGAGDALKASHATLHYSDDGYNAQFARYCARQAGLSPEAFVSRHIDVLVERLTAAGIEPTPAALEAYRDYLQPGAELAVSLAPTTSFQLDELRFYDFAAIRQILGMDLRVNDRDVDRLFDQWSMQKLEQVALQFEREQNRRQRLEKLKKERERQRNAPSYKRVALDEAAGAVGLRVKVERDSGKTLEGELEQVEEDKLWLLVHRFGGEASMPVTLRGVKNFWVYR